MLGNVGAVCCVLVRVEDALEQVRSPVAGDDHHRRVQTLGRLADGLADGVAAARGADDVDLAPGRAGVDQADHALINEDLRVLGQRVLHLLRADVALTVAAVAEARQGHRELRAVSRDDVEKMEDVAWTKITKYMSRSQVRSGTSMQPCAHASCTHRRGTAPPA